MTGKLKERLLRALWMALGKRPSLDTLFTRLLTHRKCLREVSPEQAIPEFERTEVRISRWPNGPWSTPLVDVFVLIKAAIGFESKHILELGSYRGDTARLLAENTRPSVMITAVDIDPRHGESYTGTPAAAKIRRKIGAIDLGMFEPNERFDMIFVDANHDYASVMFDSLVALAVLSDTGVILWHDYHHQSYFHGTAGVPEVLGELSTDHPIVAVKGSTLAIHSRHPGWKT